MREQGRVHVNCTEVVMELPLTVDGDIVSRAQQTQH